MRLVKLLLLVLLLLPLATLHAQEGSATPPIILASEGDFWRYDADNGTAQSFTSWGHNQSPILNEATGLVAYNSYASIWVDTLNTGGTPSGSIASNIWVIDPLTMDAFRVAEQPENASIATRTFIARSDPAWSPDGELLAWSEYHSNGGTDDTYSLGVYDMATEKTATLTLPELDYEGVPGPFSILWSHDGQFIAISYQVFDDTTGISNTAIDFYDPTLTLVNQTKLAEGSFWRSWLWLTHEEAMYLGLYLSGGKWLLIDPTTAEQTEFIGAIRGGTVNVLPGGLRVIFSEDQWLLEFAVETTTPLAYPLTFDFLNNLSLAPDSLNIAFVEDSGEVVVLDANGEEVSRYASEEGFAGVAWSNMVWETVLPTDNP